MEYILCRSIILLKFSHRILLLNVFIYIYGRVGGLMLTRNSSILYKDNIPLIIFIFSFFNKYPTEIVNRHSRETVPTPLFLFQFLPPTIMAGSLSSATKALTRDSGLEVIVEENEFFFTEVKDFAFANTPQTPQVLNYCTCNLEPSLFALCI